jgi:hypothetical protein
LNDGTVDISLIKREKTSRFGCANILLNCSEGIDQFQSVEYFKVCWQQEDFFPFFPSFLSFLSFLLLIISGSY